MQWKTVSTFHINHYKAGSANPKENRAYPIFTEKLIRT